MNSPVLGKTIADCFELVTSFANEVEGLQQVLTNMLEESLTAKDIERPCDIAGEVVNEFQNDDSGWVCTDIAVNIPLKGRGKRKIERYLGFQISMVGDTIAIPGNEEPLVHVFCWSVPCDLSSVFASFPLEDSGYPFRVVDHRLILWETGDLCSWQPNEWMFSIKLMSLNSKHELKEQVVAPVIALLNGASVPVALPESLPGLVRFPSKELLMR